MFEALTQPLDAYEFLSFLSKKNSDNTNRNVKNKFVSEFKATKDVWDVYALNT